MKKMILLTIIIILNILILGCNNMKIINEGKKNVTKIDGNLDDWKGINLHYLEEVGAVIGTVNDENHLFVMLRFYNNQLKTKIIKNGITIWLDDSCEEKKNYGLCYTGSINLHNSKITQIESPNKRNPFNKVPNRVNYNLPNPGMIKIIKNGTSSTKTEQEIDEFMAGSEKDASNHCYEFKIPLTAKLKLERKSTLCFEIGGLSDAEIKSMKSKMKSSRGRKGGGKGGMNSAHSGKKGGKRGAGKGRTGKGNKNMDNMKKQEIWIDLILS